MLPGEAVQNGGYFRYIRSSHLLSVYPATGFSRICESSLVS